MNDKQQLNGILNDIKAGIDRKNDLLMHEHIQSTIKSISSNYCKKTGFNFNDVYHNSIIEFYDLLRTYTFYDDNDGNYRESFLGYLMKYLPLRINDYYNDYTIFRNKEGIKVWSIDYYDESGSFLDEDLQMEVINNKLIDLLTIDNCYDKLSPREKQVYDYLREGYDDGYIASKLDMSYQQVYNCRKSIKSKVV